jgi:hypothetical protein
MAEFSLNSEPVKYAVIALASPIWIPFFKALFKEFNDALRDEGGLFGVPPSKEKLAEMDRDLGKFKSPLISELHEDVQRGRAVGGRPALPRAPRRGFGPRAR